VADPPLEAVAEGRPLQVTVAVYLVWIALGLGMLFVIVKSFTAPTLGLKGLVLLFAILCFAPFVWLNLKLATRRNWARIAFVAVGILGTVPILIHPENVTRLRPFDKAHFTLQTCLQLTAVMLLLLPSARRWFKPPSSPA
jgi:hypothetical protein